MTRKFDHVQETLQLLRVMANDVRFEQLYTDNKKGVPENMSKALDSIVQRGFENGKSEGIEIGKSEGIELGKSEGIELGKSAIISLMQKLFEAGRTEDARKASMDESYRNQLLKEFGLSV